MKSKLFASVAQGDLLSLGGFTCVRPAAWRRYMQSVLYRHFPANTIKASFSQAIGKDWKENDCVLTSLDQYLFAGFGVVVPADNLFKVYNPKGEGVSPCLMLEAISAVIEPLGFEIDKVLVPDAELRAGLGDSRLTVGLECAEEFDGRPGVGMINLSNGYSHAFFWKQMDPDKFLKEQFRMAVLVRPADSRMDMPALSALHGLDDYCNLLEARGLQREAAGLREVVADWASQRAGGRPVELEKGFRSEVERRLVEIETACTTPGRRGKSVPKKGCEDMLSAGQMLCRVFREFEVIC